jgi:energy-converting hydrogenase Eha subunit B
MGAVVLLLGVEEGQVVRFLLLERGRIMDEYLSVPEFHGELPPGDVIALSANPTVVARLTGADPAEVRRVVRTASAPEELPPASELVGRVAAVLGVEGAEHGYSSALLDETAIVVTRESG